MKTMIACCGLDCEKCDAYIATLHNDDALREKTASLWSKMNNAPITPEMINCAGCRTDGVKTPYCDIMCGIRKCVMERNNDTCGCCPELNSCGKVGEILKNSPEALHNLNKG